MREKDLPKIIAIFDKVTNEYEDDHTSVFSTEQQKLELFYTRFKRVIQSWQRSKQCIYKGCTNRSVPRSHTIQKSSSLKLISRNGIVLTPEKHKDGVRLVPVGINKASTFPGFCRYHESLFKEYEKHKTLTEYRHFLLQIYRTICLEIVRSEHEAQYLEEQYNWFCKHRDETIINKINTYLEMDDSIDKKSRIQNIKFKNDIINRVFNNIIQERRSTANTLRDFHLQQIESDLKQNNAIKIHGFDLDIRIPVCLAGLISICAETETDKNEVLLIVNVLPFDDNTIVIIFGRKEDTPAMNHYLSRISNVVSILNMVEDWMVNGTDHWFIDPLVWESIDKERKIKILSDCRNLGDYVIAQYNYSIFDDIRKLIINEAITQLKQSPTAELKRILRSVIRKESAKF